ncbi:MAG: hypothetical protein LUG19_09405 [Desulfovibrio sp.]|nr:hypothetical protein [Desulfovibrio sp.]
MPGRLGPGALRPPAAGRSPGRAGAKPAPAARPGRRIALFTPPVAGRHAESGSRPPGPGPGGGKPGPGAGGHATGGTDFRAGLPASGGRAAASFRRVLPRERL